MKIYGYYLPRTADEARDLNAAPSATTLGGRQVVGPYSEYEVDLGLEEDGPLTADTLATYQARCEALNKVAA